jgi:putative hemolysin
MLNKKVGEVAVGIILLIAIVVGGFFWLQGKKIEAPVAETIITQQTMPAIVQGQAPIQQKTGADNIGVGMANPASVFCIKNGGKSEIRNNPDGSQDGYCAFDNGSECEEWAYFRGECSVKKTTDKGAVMCAQDAKLCSDGSYVSRTGLKCEFAKCPFDDNFKNNQTLADLCKKGGSIFKCGEYFKEDPPRDTFEMPWLIYDSNFKLVQVCGGGAPASPDLGVVPVPEICRVSCENADMCLR